MGFGDPRHRATRRRVRCSTKRLWPSWCTPSAHSALQPIVVRSLADPWRYQIVMGAALAGCPRGGLTTPSRPSTGDDTGCATPLPGKHSSSTAESVRSGASRRIVTHDERWRARSLRPHQHDPIAESPYPGTAASGCRRLACASAGSLEADRRQEELARIVAEGPRRCEPPRRRSRPITRPPAKPITDDCHPRRPRRKPIHVAYRPP